MLANIVEKWCLRGWYKNQKIPDLCGGAEQLRISLTELAKRSLSQGGLISDSVTVLSIATVRPFSIP
ncbi:hypothetical protein [Endozoicomonas sp. SCSIO W0465]|uniref:hypothetical protein n=1 Tax=Endozoicomonas sp. SCSIO W0465 TaxID=2918516 RepID=UPI0020757161|nr:hypothetical protein [Endozoicomonas sp. SCSIO W0465]USE35751.1 hypothetical protein MJO57_27410 [Endozoicomonas sp. SCSIO W0465]